MTPEDAKPNGCQEAALGLSFYAPCNKAAQYIVGWKGRRDSPIRMCAMCADHNVKNRGGEIIETLTIAAEEVREQKTAPPADLIAEHNKIDDWLKAESKRFTEHCAPARTRMEEIEQTLHAMLLDLNAGKAEGKKASFSTDAGTAYLSTIVTPKVTDKEKYLDWCLDNWPKYGGMLQIGAPQKATLQEYQDENEGKLPPFVETSSIVRINIRRS